MKRVKNEAGRRRRQPDYVGKQATKSTTARATKEQDFKTLEGLPIPCKPKCRRATAAANKDPFTTTSKPIHIIRIVCNKLRPSIFKYIRHSH
ncbi:hypothetical protein DPMN_122271 [Dreissena polymorpha]|uniref:Uncharacterized protein n=1 Tax=Dreissena polymorpha TaxID=45954 RepID=A0A9D4GPC8_DREPO|nr:hypothetical protein DPMN_122271 [Dreissena polymorpha]